MTEPKIDDFDEPVTYSLFATFGENTDSDYSEIATADEAVRALKEFEGVLAEIQDAGVEVRGLYDLTCAHFRSDPGVLAWLRAANADDLQWAYRQLLRVFSQFFRTGPLSVQLTFELTELEEEPAGWLSIVEAADAAGEATDTVPEEQPDEELGDEDAAGAVSLHAQVGVGEQLYTVVAEAESPQWLVGDPTEPFGGALLVTSAPITGRWINSSEVFEVLR